MINFIAQHIHAKMTSRKRETYQIETRTYVLFVFELGD